MGMREEQGYIPEYVAQRDATWVVKASPPVDIGPPPETSLFDDLDRLGQAWNLTVRTMEADADKGSPEREAALERARETSRELREYLEEAQGDAAPSEEMKTRRRVPPTPAKFVDGLLGSLLRPSPTSPGSDVAPGGSTI